MVKVFDCWEKKRNLNFQSSDLVYLVLAKLIIIFVKKLIYNYIIQWNCIIFEENFIFKFSLEFFSKIVLNKSDKLIKVLIMFAEIVKRNSVLKNQ